MQTTMKKVDKETKEESFVGLRRRPRRMQPSRHDLEGLAALQPVRGEGNFITAGNASQLSDGAAAVVLMSDDEASKRGTPRWRIQGLGGRRMRARRDGHRPVFAVPKLLKRHGLTVDDIDLWELNEAFASQCLYHVTGSASTGEVQRQRRLHRHRSPVRMTRARCAGHILQEGNPAQGQVGRRHDVHRRRPGRSGTVRNLQLSRKQFAGRGGHSHSRRSRRSTRACRRS